MTYQIIDQSHEGKHGPVTKLTLEVDGVKVATLTKQGRRDPQLNWLIYGPQSWPEAKQVLLGLLELGVHADQLRSRQ